MPQRKRHRKRPATKGSPPDSFARNLGKIGKLISQKRSTEALAALELLGKTKVNDISATSRLVACTGDYLFSRSNLEEAVSAYQMAARYARESNDTNLVVRSMMGLASALLSGNRTTEAKGVATEILTLVRDQNGVLDQVSSTSDEKLQKGGPLLVGPRPPRLSVAITRLGTLFQRYGDTDLANLLYEQAIRISPNGASRARQGTARLALAADNPERAEKMARDSLQMGRYQAKTIPAWAILLTARARQNKTPVLEKDLYASLITHASKGVLARSILLIVITLRSHGSLDWREIALHYISRQKNRDSVVSTELVKILHSHSKIEETDTPKVLANQALELFMETDSGPNEMVAHAKSYVKNRLSCNQDVDTQKLIRLAKSRHGDETAASISHSMCLGAMLSKRFDLARTWLLKNIKQLPSESIYYGKSHWALARMETSLGNDADAARHFFIVANLSHTPLRFRIQASLRALSSVAKAGNSISTEETQVQIMILLNTTDDWRILLDAARQLNLADPSFQYIKNQIIERAKSLADEEIKSSTLSNQTLESLEYLSRRLCCDFGDYSGVVDRWLRFSNSELKSLHVVEGSIYYEYSAIVIRSLSVLNKSVELRKLASSIIDRDKATPEGYVIVGNEFALWLIRIKEYAEAIEHFQWIVKESPTHRRSAPAHYWLMIMAWKHNKLSEAVGSAKQLRLCFMGKPALREEWELDSRAVMFLNKYTNDLIPNSYNRESLDLALIQLNQDLNDFKI